MSKKRTYSVGISENHRATIKRFSDHYGLSEGAIIRLLISKVLDGTCEGATDVMDCCRCQFIMGCETIAQAETGFEPELTKPAEVSNAGSVD